MMSTSSFIASELTITPTTSPKEKLPKEELSFGDSFSDHMMEIDWTKEGGWGKPRISEYANLELSPASTGLHYGEADGRCQHEVANYHTPPWTLYHHFTHLAFFVIPDTLPHSPFLCSVFSSLSLLYRFLSGIQCFEGMKCYSTSKGGLRLFRPDRNMARLNSSMNRLAMPSFDGGELTSLLKEFCKVEESWVPQGAGYSLYLRPTAIGTHPFLGVDVSAHVKLFVIASPVGPYYPQGFKPVSLYADSVNKRAWPGGVGGFKLGGNYGPTIEPAKEAMAMGYNQVLWMWGDNDEVTECGAMNLFFVLEEVSATSASERDEHQIKPSNATLVVLIAGRQEDSTDRSSRQGGHPPWRYQAEYY
jgi:branched-chain amino acid aminotransferase